MANGDKYILNVTFGGTTQRHELSFPCQIGRKDDCEIVIKDPSVSKVHAKLTKQDDTIAIEDLKSANGTFVNGNKITTRRLNHSDRISFANVQSQFMIEPGAPKAEEATPEAPVPEQDEAYESKTPSPETPAHHAAGSLAEKLLNRFDRAFLPFYRRTFAKIAFPKILVPLIVVIFVLLVVLTLSPQLEETHRVIQTETMKRAQLLAKRIIDINKSFLDQNKDHLLTVTAILDEESVIEAYIVNSDSKILAPESRYGQLVSAPEVLRAVRAQDSYVKAYSLTGIVASEPVYRYSQARGRNEVYAIGVVKVSTRGEERGMSGMVVLWLQIGLFIILAGLVVSFLFIRIFTQPWRDLEEQIETALRKDSSEIPLVMNFEPVTRATKSINSILYRLSQEGGAPPVGIETPVESILPDVSRVELSEEGDISDRFVSDLDQSWLSEVLPEFESASTLNGLLESLATWFEEEKQRIGERASIAKVFSDPGIICIVMPHESHYVMFFSRFEEAA